MFVTGLFQNISFSALVIRTVATFFVCYFLGIILGVLTIESLLDSQVNKIKMKREMQAKAKDSPSDAN